MPRVVLLWLVFFSLTTLQAQVTASASGSEGSGYPALQAAGFQLESPDCVHTGFGPHVTQAFDDELQRNVFVFHGHVDEDNDRWRADPREQAYFEWGKSGGADYGAYVDWLGTSTTEASAPGEGSALPDDLIGVEQDPSSVSAGHALSATLRAFPNPTDNRIWVVTERPGDYQVQLFDAVGRAATAAVGFSGAPFSTWPAAPPVCTILSCGPRGGKSPTVK